MQNAECRMQNAECLPNHKIQNPSPLPPLEGGEIQNYLSQFLKTILTDDYFQTHLSILIWIKGERKIISFSFSEYYKHIAIPRNRKNFFQSLSRIAMIRYLWLNLVKML